MIEFFTVLDYGRVISKLIKEFITLFRNALHDSSQFEVLYHWLVAVVWRFIDWFTTIVYLNFTSVIPNTATHFAKTTYQRIRTGTPNSIYCFNKKGLLILLMDFHFAFFGLIKVNLIRRNYTWTYVFIRILTMISPYLWLSPNQRLIFWLICIILVPLETLVAVTMIWYWGYGVNWKAGRSFYHHWGKHYRYRFASGNRQLTVELSLYVYVISKYLILIDYFCATEKRTAERMLALSTPTQGKLFPDSDYAVALLEQDTMSDIPYSLLFLLVLSSLGVYSIILAGWSSNSKYAFLGALRSAAQMISYEVAISLVILPVVLVSGSLDLTMITHMQNITVWFLWPLLPISILFLIAMLAETNRTPFDLPEAEAELVAGYNVDYSSLPFAMFFLGEYCNMLLISTVYCILFLGGGSGFFDLFPALILSLKAAMVWVFFVIVRATLPRYRYDQLMDIGWKIFLPVAGGFLVFEFGVLVFFDALPVTGELSLRSIYY